MAIGIVSFALLSIMGTFSVGLNTIKDAKKDMTHAQIIAQITSDTLQTPFDRIASDGPTSSIKPDGACRARVVLSIRRSWSLHLVGWGLILARWRASIGQLRTSRSRSLASWQGIIISFTPQRHSCSFPNPKYVHVFPETQIGGRGLGLHAIGSLSCDVGLRRSAGILASDHQSIQRYLEPCAR